MPSEDWTEWAAHNLAMGIARADIAAELGKAGLSVADANRLLAGIEGSPVFRAARRLGEDVRKWTMLSDALLALEGLTHDYDSVPRVSGLSSDNFLRDYYALNRPVIITDVVATWPASQKWTLDFLADRFGQCRITYQSGRSRRDHRDSFVDHSTEATLAAYIELIRSGEETNDYYLIAHDKILDRPDFKPLIDDIVFDTRYFDPVSQPGRVFFWLGPKGSATPMHRDLGNVFFAQVMGRKRVTLIPSKQLHKVYNQTGYHSEIDFENDNLADYPLLEGAHIIDVVIAPGELLFIPIGWWHAVRSLDVSITVTGNNFRFPNVFADIF
ncbi:peptide methionine sulfoxide reductase [Hoeflea olei]|uniref:Peptide methionine sulfoxide reductase n=2 Tax=Hoeflea olei TaxID=1480615 RepID=A0A1C1YQR9_9HYPH|nr:peptide methionine sulfoxide reductase [Hoeflea olei]